MDTETTIKIAKGVTKLVIRYSVGAVVTQILQENTTPAETKAEKVQYAVGAYVIGSLVSDRVDTWTEKKFDTLETIIARFNNPSEEPETETE